MSIVSDCTKNACSVKRCECPALQERLIVLRKTKRSGNIYASREATCSAAFCNQVCGEEVTV